MQNNTVKKVILPLAGLGTRFLPLTKIIPKEVFPLVDKPIVQYLVEEALNSGIEEIIFVISPNKKMILDYFKPSPSLEKLLSKRGKTADLKDLQSVPQISFKVAYQRSPKGDGDAILKAENFIGDEPCAVLFGDDLIDGPEPCVSQLLNVFKNYNHPVIALSRVGREKFSSYGMVACEKITERLYKIKEIVEKPSPDQSPSDLAVVGKYILTPEVFEYLKHAPPMKNGEIILANAFSQMLKQGKLVYGYEVKGEWLECGNKNNYFKTFVKLLSKDGIFKDSLNP